MIAPSPRTTALTGLIKSQIESGAMNPVCSHCEKCMLTPIHFAARYDDVELLFVLLAQNDTALDARTATGTFALLMATKQGCQRFVSLLLHSGCAVDVTEKYTGFSALHLAVTNCDAAMVQLLLQNGAATRVDTKDSGGWTALHWACYLSSQKIVTLLMDHGASVAAMNSSGMTPRDLLRNELIVFGISEDVK